jgi:hypothetical protein
VTVEKQKAGGVSMGIGRSKWTLMSWVVVMACCMFLSGCFGLGSLPGGKVGSATQAWEYKDVVRSRGYPGTNNAVTGAVVANDWSQWAEDGKPLPLPVDMVSKLHQLGDQGWELVAVCPRSSYAAAWISGATSDEIWVFKRKKQQF